MELKKVGENLARIEELSKLPANEDTIKALEEQVNAALSLIKEGKGRFNATQMKLAYKKGNIDMKRYKELLSTNIRNEIEGGLILRYLKTFGPMTPQDVAKEVKVPLSRIYAHFSALLRRNEVEAVGETEKSYIFAPAKMKKLPEVEALLRIEEMLSSAIPQLEKKDAEKVDSIIARLLELRKRIVTEGKKAKLQQEILASLEAIKNLANIIEAPEVRKVNETLTLLDSIKGRLGKEEVKSAEEIIRKLKEIKERLLLARAVDLENIGKILDSIHKEAYRLEEVVPKAAVGGPKKALSISDLKPLEVTRVDEEWRAWVKREEFPGFGTVNYDSMKCVGCRGCEEVCPEKCVTLTGAFDLPGVVKMKKEDLEKKPENRRLVYELIQKLAVKEPKKKLAVPAGIYGFGEVEYSAPFCIGCKKCEEKCPVEAIELEKIWDLPKIITMVYEGRF